MPYRGQSYGGGQFYEGPGALESLVGSFLDTRSELAAEKRRRQLEDEQRAQLAEDRRLKMEDRQRNRALETVRLKDEGIVEDPAELGGGFTRIPGSSRQEIADISANAAKVAGDLKASQSEEALRAAIRTAMDPKQSPEARAQAVAEVTARDPKTGLQVAATIKPEPGIKKPWERDGFATEQEWLQSKRREAQSTRFDDGGRGTWTIREDPNTGKSYRVNATTGQVVPFEGLPSSTPTNKPATQGERTAAALYKIGLNAIKNLEGDLASGTAPLSVPGQFSRLLASRQDPEKPGGILNAAMSGNDQKFYDASTELAMAAQYALSGKAVTRVEGAKLAAQITPQFGDGKDVVAQKLARRQEWIQAVREMGGRAIPPDGRDELDDEYDQLTRSRP